MPVVAARTPHNVRPGGSSASGAGAGPNRISTSVTVIGGGVTMYSFPVTFPTGETWVRMTIANALATALSKPLITVLSPAYATDADDPGWAYSAQVARLAAGSFDVVVFAAPLWSSDDSDEGPGTTVTLIYVLG